MKTNHHRKKFFTSLGSFLLAATILLNCTSCTLRVSAAELSAGYSRKATEQGTVDDTFITALSDFSLSLPCSPTVQAATQKCRWKTSWG